MRSVNRNVSNDEEGVYNEYGEFRLVKVKERGHVRSLSPIDKGYSKVYGEGQYRIKNKNKNKSMSMSKEKGKMRDVNKGNPFVKANRHKTNFGYVYSAGGIPCRIDFGAKMKLKWSIPPNELNYDPILEICFEGLMETTHPYSFAARECIREMLSAENSQEKILPILPKLLIILRQALSNESEEIFLEAMNVIDTLSKLVKERLNGYLHLILLQINRRSFKNKYKERVSDLLREIETNGGEEALYIIKNKIPTYNTML